MDPKERVLFPNIFHCLEVDRATVYISNIEGIHSLLALGGNISSCNRETILTKDSRHFGQKSCSVACAEVKPQALQINICR